MKRTSTITILVVCIFFQACNSLHANNSSGKNYFSKQKLELSATKDDILPTGVKKEKKSLIISSQSKKILKISSQINNYEI